MNINEIERRKNLQINDINMFPNENTTKNKIPTEIKTYTNSGDIDYNNDYNNYPISYRSGSGEIITIII